MKLKLKVISGRRLGREVGFRTANFDLSDLPAQLEQGVYAVRVWLEEREWPGALYFGPRTWKEQHELVFEVHIIGFVGDIYGQELKLEVVKFVRKPKQFENKKILKETIKTDVKLIKRWLKTEFN